MRLKSQSILKNKAKANLAGEMFNARYFIENRKRMMRGKEADDGKDKKPMRSFIVKRK